MLISVGACFLVAIAYWMRLLYAAHFSSTHNIHSTSQVGAFSYLLTGSAAVLGFCASAISFWRHPASALILRVVVGLFSAVGVFMVVRGLVDLYSTPNGFSASPFRPIPFTSGLILLCTYFAACLATALPFVSARQVFRLGFVLHYGILPAALALIYLFGMPSDYYFTFSAFGLYLVAGVAFALLSFRMYELRQTFNRKNG